MLTDGDYLAVGAIQNHAYAVYRDAMRPAVQRGCRQHRHPSVASQPGAGPVHAGARADRMVTMADGRVVSDHRRPVAAASFARQA